MLSGGRTIINANSLHIPLADKSVNCAVTSPPYYGLRDYGVSGQLGLEPTPEEYITNMVAVFREVWRVMRDDGTLWLNIGDSYCGSTSETPSTRENSPIARGTILSQEMRAGRGDRTRAIIQSGIKPKDLIGIPWMLAFALRADGWYLRSEIIWHKPNPMPESVKDRPTKSHEQVFLLTKNARYYFDQEAVREPHSESSGGWQNRKKNGLPTNNPEDNIHSNYLDITQTFRAKNPAGRNIRTVWTIATQPTPFAHFATMPGKLAERCILAGCPAGGIVLDPFFGSGTTGKVATENGRQFVGLELSMDYIQAIAKKRVNTQIGFGYALR